jgi:hypothetical protein
VPGFPCGQFVASVTNFRVIEQLGRFEIEFCAVMFDLFGYLENLKDVEFSLHYSTLPKKPCLPTGGRAARC